MLTILPRCQRMGLRWLLCCTGIKEFHSLQELLQHDFSSDIAMADKAVATLKEEIRDRNTAIGKVRDMG